MKANFQNTVINLHRTKRATNKSTHSFTSTQTTSTVDHLCQRIPRRPSDQMMNGPNAVFALGNFFGNGEVFVAIPWQSLQLKNPSKLLNVNVLPAEIEFHELERTLVASLEIKRDANGCVRVTAHKNPY
jgi:hypothetical protein